MSDGPRIQDINILALFRLSLPPLLSAVLLGLSLLNSNNH